jgi:ABC-type transport system involved in multi-copper enzyme maturation permease subunit
MNIVYHILRKDLRRVRVPLAVWLVLVALSFALIGSAIKPRDSEVQAFFLMLSYLVPLLQTVMLIVIIPLVIQEEPLAGTTAFWLTRPISRGTLLASKMIFILLVLVLPPFAAEMIVLGANGASAHYLALAVPEILIGNLTLITVVALISVVTTNFGRFAIFGGVLVISACLLEFAIFWIGIFSHSFMGATASDSSHPVEYMFSLMATRWMVGEVLMIAAAAALIVHQYLKRWTTLTILLGVASLFVVFMVANAWGWNFLMPRMAMAPDTVFKSDAIKAVLTGKFDVSENPSLQGTEGPTRSVSAEVALSGVPDGYVVADEDTQCVPTLANGGNLDTGNTFFFRPGGIKQYPPDYQALVTALGGIPIINTADGPGVGGNGPRHIALFEWGADSYLRYAKTPLKFTATIHFAAAKYLQTAEIPLKEGARYEYGPERAVITSLLHEPDGLDIAIRVSRFNLLFDLDSNHSRYDQIQSMQSHEATVVYLLLNRKRREAIAESPFGTDLNMPAASGRLINRPIRISFTPRGGKSGSFPLTQDWLADATLVRMELTPVAKFKVEVTASKLILEGPDKTLTPD